MGLGHIQVDMINSFNKWVEFVFNMQIRLTCLAYKVISFIYLFILLLNLWIFYMFITIFMVVIVI